VQANIKIAQRRRCGKEVGKRKTGEIERRERNGELLLCLREWKFGGQLRTSGGPAPSFRVAFE
jgi:hypothetical protein